MESTMHSWVDEITSIEEDWINSILNLTIECLKLDTADVLSDNELVQAADKTDIGESVLANIEERISYILKIRPVLFELNSGDRIDEDVFRLNVVRILKCLFHEHKKEVIKFRYVVLICIGQIMKFSLINKISMFSEQMADVLLDQLNETNIDKVLLHIVTDLLDQVTEFGFTPKQLLRLYRHAYHQDKYSQIFYDIFEHKKTMIGTTLLYKPKQNIIFKGLDLISSKLSFTISTFLKLNSSHCYFKSLGNVGKYTFMQLKDSNSDILLEYYVENGKLGIATQTEKHIFSCFQIMLDEIYNISYVHVSEGSKRLRIDVYIDGIHVESKIVINVFNKGINSPNLKFSFIKNSCPSKSNACQLLLLGPSKGTGIILEIKSLFVLDTVQYGKWIMFLNALSHSYSGTLQDSQLSDLIHPSAYFDIYLALHNHLNGYQENLVSFTFPKSEVLLCWNSYSTNPELDKSSFRQHKICCKKGTHCIDSLNSIGGLICLLQLLEVADDPQTLLRSLDLLLNTLNCYKIMENSFTSDCGYEMLASILKSKKHLISIEILESILSYVGYNLSSPGDSILKNRVAYRALILDFEIWQGSIEMGDDTTSKFLLFQFTVFAQDSKYHQFNIRQMSEMKIIKRVLLALKKNNFDESLLQVENNILWIAVNYNHSPEVMRFLVLHVIFALNKQNPNSSDMGIETILIIIKRLAYEQPKILKTLSVKFLLSLLKGALPIRKLGVELLVLYVSEMGEKSYKAMMSSGVFSVLANLLRNDWKEDEILVKLYLGIFNISLECTANLDFVEVAKNIPAKLTEKVKSPHYLAVLSNLMKFASLELGTDDKAYAVLDNYINFLLTSKTNSVLESAFLQNDEWLGHFLFLMMSIKQRSPELNTKYSKFLGEILIDKLYAGVNQPLLILLEKLQMNYQIEFNFIFMPLFLRKVKDFQSLMALLFTDTNQTIIIVKMCICYLQSYFKIKSNTTLENQVVISLLIEYIKNYKKPNGNLLVHMQALTTEFTSSYIAMMMYFMEDLPDKCNSRKETFISCFETFMSNQSILVESHNDSQLMELFSLFTRFLSLGIGLESLAVNCMRVLLRVGDFAKIIDAYEDDEIRVQFKRLIENIFVLDDDTFGAYINENTTLCRFFDLCYRQAYETYLRNIDHTCKQTPQEYIKEKLAMTKSNRLIDLEINPFNKMIFNSEMKTLNAHLQDEIDDYYHYIGLYESLRGNCSYPEFPASFVLYHSEGLNRKRDKLIRLLDQSQGMKTDSIKAVPKELGQDSHKKDTKETPTLDSNIALGTDLETFNIISLLDKADDDFDEDKNRRILRDLFVNDRIDEVFNVTQILGLETVESIMVLGIEHLYIVDGYFFSNQGDILCSYEATDHERDNFVKLLNNLSVDSLEPVAEKFRVHSSKSWLLKNLVSISKRKFLLRDVGFELFFRDGTYVLLTCINTSRRNHIFNKLNGNITAKLRNPNLEMALKLASTQKFKTNKLFEQKDISPGVKFVDSLFGSDISSSLITTKWCNGQISNFQYLMLINTIAGRTFNDLTQYQVFPFVLSNYESAKIDLNDAMNFRDLSKPMGAQTKARELKFKERYTATQEMSTDTPPFHYGTHYSSAMIVASYLIRLRPFTESYLKLQGGKLDFPDRLFHSVSKLWKSLTGENTTDVRELVPEFFYLPNFLLNTNHLQFGKLQNGKAVNDVELPPWCDHNPVKFVNIMRDALESDHVSKHLDEWIDLIFGYKQQGSEAVNATNVFHHLSYNGSIDLDKIHDQHERAVVTSIIHNFGQTPLQIFKKKHPKKNAEFTDILHGFKQGYENRVQSEQEHGGCHRLILDQKSGHWIAVKSDEDVFVDKSGRSMRIKLINKNGIMIDNVFKFQRFVVGGSITALKILGIGKFLLGFDNGLIKLYEYTNDDTKYITNAQRSMVKLQYIKTAKKDWSLIEIGSLIGGHYTDICDIKYFVEDRILISLDKDREWLCVWHEPSKVGGSGELSLMEKLETDEDDGKIMDFDIFEDDNYVFGITAKGRVLVWKLNYGLVFQKNIGQELQMIRNCTNFMENDYCRGWLFMVKTVNKFQVYYLSKQFDIFQDVFEIKDLHNDEICDFKLNRVGVDKFNVIIGTDEKLICLK